MLNNAVIDAILKTATNESKNSVIKMFISYIHQGMNYNDDKCNHILEMLVDNYSIKTIEDVNFDYIKEHPELIMWKYEDYNIKDVEIERVDNIDCVVIVKYKFLEKINEDRVDVDYQNNRTNINYIDNPDILKK